MRFSGRQRDTDRCRSHLCRRLESSSEVRIFRVHHSLRALVRTSSRLPSGSVLRADFREDSDVDVLVTFEPDAQWSLFDLTTMQQELAEAFGRPVDLVEEAALRNPYRREAILRAKQTLYAA